MTTHFVDYAEAHRTRAALLFRGKQGKTEQNALFGAFPGSPTGAEAGLARRRKTLFLRLARLLVSRATFG